MVQPGPIVDPFGDLQKESQVPLDPPKSLS
jgi:hypothetical protein